MPKIFVIHHHKSRTEHYDLRLEYKGAMPSWAITKVPPKKSGIKRLAIETTAHTLKYAKFEGTIPKGQYGAGTVKIWDSGEIEVTKWEPNEIVANFKGNKLKGEYALIRFDKAGPKKWLFFKKK